MSGETFGIISPHPPIFVPEVGGRDAPIATASLEALDAARAALSAFAPETIVLMSPHAPTAYDAFVVDVGRTAEGDSGAVRRPTGSAIGRAIPHSRSDHRGSATTSDLDSRRERRRAPEPGWLDHGAIVPLSFLEPTGTVPLVLLSLAWVDLDEHRRLGEVVRESRRASAGASPSSPAATCSPPTHARRLGGLLAERRRARRRDLASVRRPALGGLLSLDPDLIEAGGECGLRSIITLGGFLGADPVPTRVLAYEGPWGVGYLTALVGHMHVARSSRAHDHTGKPRWPRHGRFDRERDRLACAARHRDLLHDRANRRSARAPRRRRVPRSRGRLREPAPRRDAARLHRHHRAHPPDARRGGRRQRDPAPRTRTRASSRSAPDELADLDIKVDVLHPPEKCRSRGSRP